VSISDEKPGRALAVRKRIDAVFALLNLPGAWRGQEADAIARSLVEVLVRLLRVDAALVQIGDGDAVIEHHLPERIDAAALFTAATKGERWAPADLELQLGAPASSTAVRAIAIDLPGECGSAVVASSRSSFPTEHELLVLEMAVTHAAIAIASSREARTQRLLADERSRLERVNAMLASLYSRAEFLADASAILFSSLDIDEGLSRVAQLAVPRLGDWMVIFAEGRTITVHREPGQAEQARERAQSFVSAFGAPRAGAADGMALAPITAGAGALGVLVVGSEGEGATIPEETLSLLERLGERCGLAVDTARRYREAREADQRKDEFLAILGHELRHPLSPIVTALSLMKLREPRLFERERAIMERQVGHLSRLVDDLLDVSRITRGKIQIEHERVDLHGVVARAVEMIGPQFERRAQHVMMVSSADPLTVQGDAMRLEQVVTNLLTNAAKYTDPGGRIRVTLASDGGQAELRVSDSGMGIAPEILPRVFEAFVQDQASLDRAHGGLGLGLSIVRRLVEMHGGTVAAHSEGRGRGSEFVVRLPLAASASHPDAPPERATA
jgi:signal transduction histidine kinase